MRQKHPAYVVFKCYPLKSSTVDHGGIFNVAQDQYSIEQ